MNTIDKTLLWLTRIGVFFMPFIPLIVSGTMFFPFITGKNFAFRIVALSIFALWLILILRRPEFRPKNSYILFAVVLFIVIIGIADLSAENPFKAFWSNFERMEGYITILHLALYFVVASSVLNSEKLWTRLFATSVGVSAFLGIYGMLQLAGKIVINQGGVRLDGTFGNAAYFAGYMLFHVFLTLYLIFRHRLHIGFKWFYGVALFLQLFVLYFSATRGAVVGLAGGLLVATLLAVIFEKHNKKLRTYAGIVAVLLVVLSIALYAGRNTNFVKHSEVLTRFASISIDSGASRFMVWGMAYEGFKERPLLGWGQEGFNYVFNKYYNPHMWGQEQWFDRTHNIFFDWLIAGGLLGLLSYLSLYVLILYYLWRTPANGEVFGVAEKSVLTGLVASYFIQNFFVFDNIGTYLLFFSLLAFIHFRASSPFSSADSQKALELDGFYYGVAGVVLVLLAGGLYFFDFRNMLASSELIQAIKGQPSGITKNLSYFEQMLGRRPFATQEASEQLMQIAMTVAGSKEAPKEMKEKFVSLAVSSMTKEIERAPNDARLRVFMGSFLNRLGQYDEALAYLEKAHQLSPTKQTISFELASSYLARGKSEEALALLKKAFEDAPEYQTARFSYAVGAIYAKKPALEQALLTPEVWDSAVRDERVIKAYYDTKQYGKVLEIWKRRAELEPTNGQIRVSLAAAYLLVGERQQSIATLEEALKLRPEAKEEIEAYIKEIQAGRNP